VPDQVCAVSASVPSADNPGGSLLKDVPADLLLTGEMSHVSLAECSKGIANQVARSASSRRQGSNRHPDKSLEHRATLPFKSLAELATR
jgi:hypothetical protein